MKILINGKKQNYIKAIQLNDHWVVVDTKAEIKKDDYVYKINHSHTFIFFVHNDILADCYNRNKDNYHKIIASTKFIDKSIPVIKFVDVECTVEELEKTKLPDVINLEIEEIPFVKVSWETDEMFKQRKNNSEKIYKLKTKPTPEGEIIEIRY
jgi:hypothetical protein